MATRKTNPKCTTPLPLAFGRTGHPVRVSPTDVSQFVRLEQCERFLRFRLAEREGQQFMEAYDVTRQRITPLLTLSGREFESDVEKAIGRDSKSVHYAQKSAEAGSRPDNNDEVVAETRRLRRGRKVVLFQPRLEVEVDGWLIRGDADVLLLERRADGTLHALIVDIKSTTTVKVEHRLQVAFYHLMLQRLLADADIACASIRTGILFRGPADAAPDDEPVRPLRQAANEWFGLKEKLLEIIDDPEVYLQSVRDLVTGPDSVARRIARVAFEDLSFHLAYKCDGCLYNEYCMKWSAEQEDLSLLPYLTGVEKEALRRAAIRTIKNLAMLKEFSPAPPGGTSRDLLPAVGREAEVKKLAATWPVGPRLDELVHRARSFRRSVRKDGTAALSYIPGKGTSSLPATSPELNPNLVWVYVDAQHDYLNDRVYLLGALVVACRDGVPDPARRRSLVHVTGAPPERLKQEKDLLIGWVQAVLKAVIEMAHAAAQPDGSPAAPVHVVFFNRFEQRLLLEALARNFPPLLQATPPLYDFLTQLAAFDSPIATYLDEEIRELKNFPMTCQSLQSLATYLKFDWSQPHKFRDLFKARLFDYLGKLDIDGDSEWYTRRSRFNSQIPLEHAYAAWGDLPPPDKDKADDFADFRMTTLDLLRQFQARRLEAIEHVARSFSGNPLTRKTPFVLPNLAAFDDKACDLARALHEFVTIERHVELGEWKRARHAPPERRVLMGETLLVRYREEDQPEEVAEAMRENRRRQQLRQQYEAEFRAAHPGEGVQLTKEQKDECRWSWGQDGLTVRLRLDDSGLDCDLHEALGLSNLRPGESLVLSPRWTVDERLPAAQQKEFTPTPKQVLYASRCDLGQIVATERDKQDRFLAGYAEVMLRASFVNDSVRPFVFSGMDRPLEDGKLYALDPCPDSWYGYWCKLVVDMLCRDEPNTLYRRLAEPPQRPTDTPSPGLPGQKKFLAGLDAFHQADLLYRFEEAKREFIGKHGTDPILMVQGPPGTGKSFATAFAVFARLQGAMAAGRDCRVLLSCKTHAATDVLLKKVVEVQQELERLRRADPPLFHKHFDGYLLELPLYRVTPRQPPPDGVISLEKGVRGNADTIQGQRWCMVAATPGGVYRLLKDRWPQQLSGHYFCDVLVLDEASQMNLPEAMLAALPLAPEGQLIVVGDHRQMPPIVKHDWGAEPRRTFRQYQVYESLFDTLRERKPPMIKFAESFRLHAAVAEFLRQEVYRHDGIPYFSRRKDVLPAVAMRDPMVAAVLRPEYPLVVVVHDEVASQIHNPFEQQLIEPIIQALADPKRLGLDAEEGLGVVVPHRAQRAALQDAFPELSALDPVSGLPVRSAIDTVERFQGGERKAIVVSATESDPGYLLMAGEFLLDPRRLTVALSRAKEKMILVASRSVFSLFSPDEDVFANAQLWKNLLLRTCTVLLWEGERDGQRVAVWGGKSDDGNVIGA